MAAADLFARFVSEFSGQAGSAKANADRQATAERLLTKAEYEFYQLRRDLAGVLDEAPSTEPVDSDERAAPSKAA